MVKDHRDTGGFIIGPVRGVRDSTAEWNPRFCGCATGFLNGHLGHDIELFIGPTGGHRMAEVVNKQAKGWQTCLPAYTYSEHVR